MSFAKTFTPLRSVLIGTRLRWCFIFVVLLLTVGNGLLLWQFSYVRYQREHLLGVDEELIAVLRFQTHLRSFHAKLNELAQSEDTSRLARESTELQKSLIAHAAETQAAFSALPWSAKPEPAVLATLEAIQSSLPVHLEAIRALASTGDWTALRVRLKDQVEPLESLSTELVQNVDRIVAADRAVAVASITNAQARLTWIIPLSVLMTLLFAILLGVVITESITDPLRRLMEGSRALARGEFEHEIPIDGKDELAQLGTVFNETAGRLRHLYEDLRGREEKLRESEHELSQLVEFAPTHVFVLSSRGTGIYASRVVLDYYGLTMDEWLADGVPERIVHPEDVQQYLTQRNQGLAGEAPFELEVRRRRKDGTYRWFVSRFNPMPDEKGNTLRWYVAQSDIEEVKLAAQRTENENLALREEVDRSSMFEEIVGSSQKLLRVLSDVGRVAPTDSTVLILGETGTGKELIARAIHKQSNRGRRAFIRVNCATIPASLISSELFGHEKGAFTGAFQRRLGRFEAADGGTIFLDEIGELPAEIQVSLLRVLQEREFERLGSNQPIAIDVRILAATNRNLKAAVTAGTFRSDLFYRLNVFPIQIPSLRERTDDIPLLVEYLIDRYGKRTGKKIRNIQKRTLELFAAYEWPGNIRELQNVVERAVLLCDGDTFSVDESWLRQARTAGDEASATSGSTTRRLGRLDSEEERTLIENALRSSNGRVSGPSGAAAKLGIPRQTLESKMASLGITKNRFQ
ncbi:MAG TPA: sigma 54-interacting transcriptional regulator, partial [Candidatus Acidoferrum sp.]|nr:sigma 54-interacting transcriptional regulator [Candidatus Acidoferrum sp.]